MPNIPSIEWIRLQFCPNNDTVKKAALLSGRLGVKRAIQTRTLRKEHPDQHWVNCMNLYHFEWIIKLRSLTNGVEFFGQDDKAKIPVGDSVAVSTGVRSNDRSSIVSAEEENSLTAMDHDFHSVLSCRVVVIARRCGDR
jgi:hypothetical protein